MSKTKRKAREWWFCPNCGQSYSEAPTYSNNLCNGSVAKPIRVREVLPVSSRRGSRGKKKT